ncbi:MAG: hypothetical protein KG003_03380 [Bacteroidetes bacterium]|nr:hypothetical protein [Bacteroidota bacterium]
MEVNKHKIPSPFQAPDGYFDGFEDRLEARMSPAKGKPVMKVQRNQPSPVAAPVKTGRPLMEWVAIAATVLVLVISGTVFYMNRETQTEVPIAVNQEKKPVMQTPAPVKAEPKLTPEMVEDQVLAVMLEEGNTAVSNSTTVKKLNKKEIAAAAELENEGLIVMDAEDGIFDQFEL